MTNSKKTWTAHEREMLFRKNYGKIGLKPYLEKLSQFFTTPMQANNLLGLDETDRIIKKHNTILQEQRWVSLTPSQIEALAEPHKLDKGWEYQDAQQMLLFAQSLLDKQGCYLYWHDDSHYCGLYWIDAGTQINLDYDFYNHKPDGIAFYAIDESFKLYLEYSHREALYADEDGFFTFASFLECTYQLYQTK